LSWLLFGSCSAAARLLLYARFSARAVLWLLFCGCCSAAAELLLGSCLFGAPLPPHLVDKYKSPLAITPARTVNPRPGAHPTTPGQRPTALQRLDPRRLP